MDNFCNYSCTNNDRNDYRVGLLYGLHNYAIINGLTEGSTHELDVYMGCTGFSPLSNTTSEQVNLNQLALDNSFGTGYTWACQINNGSSNIKLLGITNDLAAGNPAGITFPVSPGVMVPATGGIPITGYFSSNFMLQMQNITIAEHFGRVELYCNFVLVGTTKYFLDGGATSYIPIIAQHPPMSSDILLFFNISRRIKRSLFWYLKNCYEPRYIQRQSVRRKKIKRSKWIQKT